MEMKYFNLIKIDQTVTRAITSPRVSTNLVHDITDGSDEQFEILNLLEGMFKPAAYQSAVPIINRPFEESDHFNAIEFPFKSYASSRYSDGKYGVWYGSDIIETAIYETAYHWINLLMDTHDSIENLHGVKIDKKVYSVSCSAMLIDAVSQSEAHPSLVSNNYEACQQLASEVRSSGLKGISSPSARYKGGICFAIFDPAVLSDPKNICHLTYQVVNHQIKVFRATDKLLMAIPIDSLMGGSSNAAAPKIHIVK